MKKIVVKCKHMQQLQLVLTKGNTTLNILCMRDCDRFTFD